MRVESQPQLGSLIGNEHLTEPTLLLAWCALAGVERCRTYETCLKPEPPWASIARRDTAQQAIQHAQRRANRTVEFLQHTECGNDGSAG